WIDGDLGIGQRPLDRKCHPEYAFTLWTGENLPDQWNRTDRTVEARQWHVGAADVQRLRLEVYLAAHRRPDQRARDIRTARDKLPMADRERDAKVIETDLPAHDAPPPAWRPASLRRLQHLADDWITEQSKFAAPQNPVPFDWPLPLQITPQIHMPADRIGI